MLILPAGIGMFALIVAFALSAVAEGEGRIGWIIYASLSITASGRILLSRVRVRDEGIIVHNPIRRHPISWSEIDRFSMDRVSRVLRVGTVHLKSGSAVRMWGLVQDAKAGHLDRATRYVDELNGLLAARRR